MAGERKAVKKGKWMAADAKKKPETSVSFSSPATRMAAVSSGPSCPKPVGFLSCPTCSAPTLVIYFAGLLLLIYGQLAAGRGLLVAIATALLLLSFVGPWMVSKLRR